jgi:isopentenyl-diphosphate delta-isomerase
MEPTDRDEVVDLREDLVVLLDDAGRPSGTAPRRTVHTDATPLHLAFSCYVLAPDGAMLVTRRALSKATWPGVWTNAFCGHPRPGEAVADAVTRYAAHELGLVLDDVELAIPDFRYRATDASGVVEHEVCPVYVATTTGLPDPHPDEVMDVRWVATDELGRAVVAAPWAFSPWMVAQVHRLAGLVDDAGLLAKAC